MSRTNTQTDRSVRGSKLFWVTFLFVVCNFTIAPLFFHRGFTDCLDTSIEDVFMALVVWYFVAEKIQ